MLHSIYPNSYDVNAVHCSSTHIVHTIATDTNLWHVPLPDICIRIEATIMALQDPVQDDCMPAVPSQLQNLPMMSTMWRHLTTEVPIAEVIGL